MTQRKIEIGKSYMLIHGHNKGPDFYMSPSVTGIDIEIPVTVLRVYRKSHYGETEWEIEYTNTDRKKIVGYVCDRSFGEEVK